MIKFENKEAFDNFVNKVPSRLKTLETLLKNSKNFNSINVDFNIDGFSKIECFFADLGKGKEKCPISSAECIAILTSYYGEMLIHHGGGKWTFNDFEGDMNNGTPMIFGGINDGGMGFAVSRGATRVYEEDRAGMLTKGVNYMLGKLTF